MSDAAILDGWLTLYRCDKDANCMGHFERELAKLKVTDPRMYQAVSKKIKKGAEAP